MSCSPTSLEAPHVWADGGETSAGVSHEASATAARRGRAGLAETAGRDGTERSAAGARGAPPATGMVVGERTGTRIIDASQRRKSAV